LAIEPAHAGALNNRGNILCEQRRFEEALESYAAALEVNPDYAEAHRNRATALEGLSRYEEALAAYARALELKPDYAEAFNNRGIALQHLHRLDEAVASFDAALALEPHFAQALYNRGAVAARMCAWDQTVHDVSTAKLGLGGEIPPFATLAALDDPKRQLEEAQAWVEAKCSAASAFVFAPRPRPEKLRIGYFSADFREHAVMYLIAGMLEKHDRDKFEVHAFSYGPDRGDKMGQRIRAGVDRFHDVRALGDGEIARCARDAEIDIAIDLNGHTPDGRLAIFAQRPAPVQINYLGYPGADGAAFIDYIIADNVVAPKTSREFFTEKIITLPNAYQMNDDTRVISDRIFIRSELGLPDVGFVFACFNNSFKISAAEFDVWMRLLSAVPQSVLWLLGDNAWAEANLRKEAKARNLEERRLVFAERMPLEEHLARHRCADLFLDTFNYNAHTTASDALWVGLPIITKLGKSFAARVAGSLLYAIDMPELVTSSVAEYEQLAQELALDPARLAKLREKLGANRLTTPLFRTEELTRRIERGYELAYQRFADGLQPDHIELG
jgi:predicted O-linked N-acetylglucosamine transferase (SPINDLY family)